MAGTTGDTELLELFAVTAPGLEPLAATELANHGIAGEVESGGVRWRGSPSDLHIANLHLRTATRVLVRIGGFRARTFFELERHARRIAWDAYVAPGDQVRFRVTSSKSKLYHEGAIAERLADALGRRVPAVVGRPDRLRPDEEDDCDGGGQLFVMRVLRDHCTLSADTSGDSLYRRGYREAVAKAPLRESLAAAMVLASGWRKSAPLVDPLCGSGTIPIEAALLARNIAPGLANVSRNPRVHRYRMWPSFEPGDWEETVSRARERIRPAAPAPILGSDRDAGAIAAATANATRAGVLEDLALRQDPISALQAPAGPGLLLTNPPYGHRVGEGRPLRDLYATLGRVARERLPGWHVALLSADPRLEAQLRISLEEILRTRNGGIPVRLVRGPVPGTGPAVEGDRKTEAGS